MQDSDAIFRSACEVLAAASKEPTEECSQLETMGRHQESRLQSRAEYSERNSLMKEGSLRSALVRNGKYSRQAGSRVRFAEPLVESYFSVPSCDQTPCLVSIVPGEQDSSWDDVAMDSFDVDVDMESPLRGTLINNPIYGSGRSVFLVTGGGHEESDVNQDFYARYRWELAGRNKGVAPQDPETEMLCGVGLAWILFGLGWLLFPIWYIGMFSTCLTRDKRDQLGALACGIGSLVATLVLSLVLVDSQDAEQPFIDSNFHL